MFLLLLLGLRWCLVWTDGCQTDRNQDHRVRVSCVNQKLTAPPDAISSNTEILVLSGNLFSSLSWAAYSVFTDLHELDLSHNHITALEPPGPVLEKLSVLRLSGNRLTGLGGLVFRCAPNLMEVYLDRNQIRSLHDATFSELPRLEVINLSHNKLPALPPRLLQRVSSSALKTFDLENNSVSIMPDGFFLSKPELPYVYLSFNPWICSCAVGYLHAYLNDQEHNVYKHDGPNDIIPAAETVVCSGPFHLLNRPIMELEENDFCPPDTAPQSYPRGDVEVDRAYILPAVTDKPLSDPQMSDAPHDATTVSLPLASTSSWMPTGKSWVTQSWTEILFEFWTLTEYISIPKPIPTSSPKPDIPTRGTTESPAKSKQPETSMLPTTTGSQSLRPVLTTSRPLVIQTTYPTSGPTTGQSRPKPYTTVGQSRDNPHTTAGQYRPNPHTTIGQYRPNLHTTVGQYRPNPRTTIDQSSPNPQTTFGQSTPNPHNTIGQSRPNPHTFKTEYIPNTPTGPYWADAFNEGSRTLPWCLWLFAGFVLLCVLSALVSCFLFVWLLRNYLIVHRRLKSRSWRRSDCGVTLRGYRRTENTPLRETDRVSFLALEQIKDVQAVFRSVLFIDEPQRMTADRDASKIQLVSVADGPSDQEEAARMSGQVFRKTLYRMISREQEASAWMEEHCEHTSEGTSAHYSLILREDTGRRPLMQWLIGEWELERGGVAYERSSTLIGQPTNGTLE
nr:platelet glycoprotein Ib alpha chain-like [Danio rerio]|eukprot:XP_009295421.1 platelet glycoprotein Ib alpha chain-like [Danio rerio]